MLIILIQFQISSTTNKYFQGIWEFCLINIIVDLVYIEKEIEIMDNLDIPAIENLVTF